MFETTNQIIFQIQIAIWRLSAMLRHSHLVSLGVTCHSAKGPNWKILSPATMLLEVDVTLRRRVVRLQRHIAGVSWDMIGSCCYPLHWNPVLTVILEALILTIGALDVASRNILLGSSIIFGFQVLIDGLGLSLSVLEDHPDADTLKSVVKLNSARASKLRIVNPPASLMLWMIICIFAKRLCI